jgi:hypothetical protein
MANSRLYKPRLSQFGASSTSGVAFLQFGRCYIGSRTRNETTIERIFREVTGRRMPPSTKRILLRKWNAKRYSH